MAFFDNDEPSMPGFGDDSSGSGNEWVDNTRSFIWETLKVVIISMAIILPVRYFLIQPFYVQGASMEPNFFDNEYLIINEVSYRFEEPQRGDIVVFRYPRNPKEFFIKRIVGLPGEEIEIHDNTVTIYNSDQPDGVVLDETYLGDGTRTSGNIRAALNQDEYYVLGDNRGSSLDSRNFGGVKRDAIIGKVWVRGWPLDRIQTFDQTLYDFSVTPETN